MSVKILSVGQCGADSRAISRTLSDRFSASVVSAHSADDAHRKAAAGGFALVLINRVLDADGSSGLDLVDAMVRAGGAPVMLVSDRADAQDAAVAVGAFRGFGKSALSRPETAAVIERALGLPGKNSTGKN